MPKRKPDQVIVHRVELQEKERESLEFMAMSFAAKNYSASIGNLVTPVLGATATGVGAALGILAYFELTQDEYKGYAGLLAKFAGVGLKRILSPEEKEKRQEKRAKFFRNLNLLRTSISNEIKDLN